MDSPKQLKQAKYYRKKTNPLNSRKSRDLNTQWSNQQVGSVLYVRVVTEIYDHYNLMSPNCTLRNFISLVAQAERKQKKNLFFLLTP